MSRRLAKENTPSLKGRGAADNPANRFERCRLGFDQKPLRLNSADFQNPREQTQLGLGF